MPKEIDILDDIKKAEKIVKVKMLVKIVSELKKKARQINELKEECLIMLEEIDIDKKDIKRIIDFVNESGSVKLTKGDKKELRQKIRKNTKDDKQIIENEVQKKIENFTPFVTGGTTDNFYFTGTTADSIMLNNAESKMEVKL